MRDTPERQSGCFYERRMPIQRSQKESQRSHVHRALINMLLKSKMTARTEGFFPVNIALGKCQSETLYWPNSVPHLHTKTNQ